MHFFNPVPVLPLVELVPSLLTSPATVQRVQEVAEDLGKTVIRSPDRAGFVVNALLVPYLLSAIRMLEPGFASPRDIDQGMVGGCAHPLGPLQLTDLIGLDTTKSIAESLYAEFKGAAVLSAAHGRRGPAGPKERSRRLRLRVQGPEQSRP